MQRGAAPQVESTGTQTTARTPATVPATVPGLEYDRFFTREGIDPFDEIEWDIRSAVIGNEKGNVVFEQRDVEIPRFWSQQATNIVVSKYFRGTIGTPERERSVKQLIGRVVDTITAWAVKQKYFASDDDLQAFSDDLKHLLVYQKAAFNSPVWFNVGFEKAPAVLRVLHQLRCRTRWSRSSAWRRPRGCSSSSDRARARTCRRSGPRASSSPAAERRRVRCRS